MSLPTGDQFRAAALAREIHTFPVRTCAGCGGNACWLVQWVPDGRGAPIAPVGVMFDDRCPCGTGARGPLQSFDALAQDYERADEVARLFWDRTWGFERLDGDGFAVEAAVGAAEDPAPGQVAPFLRSMIAHLDQMLTCSGLDERVRAWAQQTRTEAHDALGEDERKVGQA